MTGTVRAATPWTRTALRNFTYAYPDALAEIEAKIPAEHWLVLIAAGHRPGQWGAILTSAQGQVARTTGTYPTVGMACWAAIEAGKVAANA